MKFKEFARWCNDRWFDGCWGFGEAIACIDCLDKIKALPFWKRQKVWHEKYEKFMVNEIVIPINNKIKEVLEEHKNEIIDNH